MGLVRENVLILLDVDGVLNPRMDGEALELESVRAALVRELASLGRVVWATTWPGTQTWPLTLDLSLPSDTASIPFPTPMQADPANPASTPKLHLVNRWLARNLDESSAVVWIDDQLKGDVTEWALAFEHPVLLVRPEPLAGLTSGQVDEIRAFLAS